MFEVGGKDKQQRQLKTISNLLWQQMVLKIQRRVFLQAIFTMS